MTSAEPQFLPPQSLPEAGAAASRRRMFLIGSATLIAVGGLVTALVLGTIGYDVRRSNMHDARLKRILLQKPTVYQVTEGLKEKAPLVQIVETPEDLQQALDRWGGVHREEILDRAQRYPQLRIFAAGDMVYFIFFDSGSIMRDYVYVSAR